MTTESTPIAAAIEDQDWLEPVESGLQNAVSKAYESAGPTGRSVKNFLHGVWLGHPLHPVLTDIPIGAWTATAVLDAVDDPAADTTLKIGLVGAVASAVTGLTDWQSTDGKARRVGVVHGLLNLTSAGLYIASWSCRKNGDRSTGRILSSIGFAISAAAAYLGGNLVYEKRIGVDHAQAPSRSVDWTAVLDAAQLREGEMRRVQVEDAPVMLAKENGRIYAIGAVCSHLGGPLEEGKLENGVVQCPWHGSRFAIDTGTVVDGPATHPQPCFEARVRDGRIEVRSCGPK